MLCSVVYFEVQIALILFMVCSEQSASCLSGFSVRLFCFVRGKP